MDVRLDVGPEVALVARRVALVQERKVVIDDHVDLHDVDATRDDVRGDQDLIFALPEAVDDRITLRRVLRSVQRCDLVPFCRHPLGNAVGGVSMLNCVGNSGQERRSQRQPLRSVRSARRTGVSR